MASTTCGYCKRLTHMTLYTGPEVKSWTLVSKRYWQSQSVFQCDNCANLSVAAVTTEDDPARLHVDVFDDQFQVRWQPQAVTWSTYEDVPKHIADAATEAHACSSIKAYRAAVLLTRAVVEATAKEHGITSGNLLSKIDKMAEEGLIRKALAEAAHEVRYLGNDMAHGDFDTAVEEVDAEDSLTIMADVLEEVFQSPARIERMKARRSEKKPDAAGGA